MAQPSVASSVPVVVGGIRLTPPRRVGDCSCIFCSSFRSGHLIWRAVGVSAVVPVVLTITLLVWHDLAHRQVQGGSASVGVLLIISTMVTFFAACLWYQPIRRLLHRRRPRTTAWPPE